MYTGGLLVCTYTTDASFTRIVLQYVCTAIGVEWM
jgi:hypothetical protein